MHLGQDCVRDSAMHARPMAETSSRLLKLLSLLQTPARLAGRASSPTASRSRAGRSGATSSGCASSAIPSRRPPGRRAATGCRPARRCRRCCSTTTRRSPSRSGLRTAAGASVTGIEETSIRALVKLEQVLPAHLRRRVGALQAATATLARLGPDGRPAGADGDRRRVPRPRAPALRVPRRATGRGRAARSSRTRSSNLGRRWYLVAWDLRARGLADLPAGPAGAPRRRPAAASPPRTLPDGDDAASYVARNRARDGLALRARVTVHAPAAALEPRLAYLGGTVEPLDDRPLRVPHERRPPRLARDADRHARLRVRGPRAARARRAHRRAGGAADPLDGPAGPRRGRTHPMTSGDIEGQPAVGLEAGDLQAAFVPGAGMVGASLRHRGEELLGLRDGLAAYVPAARPWGSRCCIPGRTAWAATPTWWRETRVILAGEGGGLRREEHGLPIHGLLAASPGLAGGRLGARARRRAARLRRARRPARALPVPAHRRGARPARAGRPADRHDRRARRARCRCPWRSAGIRTSSCPARRARSGSSSCPTRRHLATDDRGIPTGATAPARPSAVRWAMRPTTTATTSSPCREWRCRAVAAASSCACSTATRSPRSSRRPRSRSSRSSP